MLYLIVLIALVCIGFFTWTSVKDKEQKKNQNKKNDKPLFRTEEDIEEYGKPMDSHPVDFDDAE